MWLTYRDCAADEDGDGIDIYGRSVLLRLVRVLTRREQKRQSSAHYKLGALV